MKVFTPALRPLFLCALLTCFLSTGISQTEPVKIQRLSRLLLTAKEDSNKVTLLWQLAEQYQSFKPDTSLQLAQKSLLLAQRTRYIEGESRSLAILATSQYLLGDYPAALHNYMLKLKIEEKRDNPRNYASALNNIGITYILLEDYPSALEYLHRADSIVATSPEVIKSELKYNIEVNMGEAYYRMKNARLAAFHFDNARKIVGVSDSAAIGTAILGQANVLLLNNELNKSLVTYREAYTYLRGGSDADILCELHLGQAKAYDKLGLHDSAIFFANNSYALAEQSKFLSRQLDAATLLSSIYNQLKKFDSAFSYLDRAGQLQDAIKGREKIKASVILSMNEKMRQAEIVEENVRDKKARYQRLQWSIIAICIPILFLITLLISRRKVSRKLVTLMCIISLLFLFEFLTLVLHPVIAEFTHHIPVFELLIFVCIAALLVPAHHRLEHILISKLAKNKSEIKAIPIKTNKMRLRKT